VQNHPINDFRSVVDPDAQIVDVRTVNEVVAGMLPGAVNIPVRSLKKRTGELDSSRRVIVVCQSGMRSAKAAKILKRAGFNDVVNLTGGMAAYRG